MAILGVVEVWWVGDFGRLGNFLVWGRVLVVLIAFVLWSYFLFVCCKFDCFCIWLLSWRDSVGFGCSGLVGGVWINVVGSECGCLLWRFLVRLLLILAVCYLVVFSVWSILDLAVYLF